MWIQKKEIISRWHGSWEGRVEKQIMEQMVVDLDIEGCEVSLWKEGPSDQRQLR